MSSTLRNNLLRSAGVFALLAAHAGAASAATANGGGSTLATPLYEAVIGDISSVNSNTYNYCTSGSGAAQTAFLTNAIGAFGCPPTQGFSSPGLASTYPTTGSVDFGASDAALTTTQITAYLNLASNNSHPVIQLPTFGTPITLPFNIATATQANGGINLSNDDVCGIFSGKLTNWSQVSTHPTTAPLTVIYRSDGSGTSFLLTQHLGATCTNGPSGNSNFATTGFAGNTTFASFFPGSTVPTNFVAASGSPAIAAAVLANSNSVGYVSPDLTREAFDNHSNTSLPFVADVNSKEPTTTATSNALGTATLPTTPSDQTQWVPAVANPSAGYPIVGYTTWDVASCYASHTTGAAVVSYLNAIYNTDGTFTVANAELNARGFVPLPGVNALSAPTSGSFAADVVSTFLSNNGGLSINTTTDCTGGR